MEVSALFGEYTSMSKHTNQKLYELHIIQRWLKHRLELSRVATNKYSRIVSETQMSLAVANFQLHHCRMRTFEYALKQVEFDIKTLVAGGSGPGVKGRKRQCQSDIALTNDLPTT